MTTNIILNSAKISIAVITLVMVSACTTPETVLKNDKTGQVTRCGGNVAYAGILYPFMKQADEKCVSDYQNQGFTPTNTKSVNQNENNSRLYTSRD